MWNFLIFKTLCRHIKKLSYHPTGPKINWLMTELWTGFTTLLSTGSYIMHTTHPKADIQGESEPLSSRSPYLCHSPQKRQTMGFSGICFSARNSRPRTGPSWEQKASMCTDNSLHRSCPRPISHDCIISPLEMAISTQQQALSNSQGDCSRACSPLSTTRTRLGNRITSHHHWNIMQGKKTTKFIKSYGGRFSSQSIFTYQFLSVISSH